jgi:2-succinyl-5-enolpyruvyl-6-hydroxy-3-cyclohexene-1-carboxylate synthase
MYTDDKNAQVVLSLLKKFGIKKIVISPGTTNVPIARSVQNDPYFEVHSVVDERSAAYFATGLSFASGEPVVISCTGATASRNYLSGLTEAYYRNIPVIALTSQHHTIDYNDLVPQVTDRTVSQNDVKRYAALLPQVKDNDDLKQCVFKVNKALTIATTKGGGPVHINLPVNPKYSFTSKELPEYTKIDFFRSEQINTKDIIKELSGKRVGIFIGSHKPFKDSTISAISKFTTMTGAAVFYDHTSCYTGKNGILTAQISDLLQANNTPDLLIDIGSVSGDYSASRLFNGITTWRVSEDGEFHNRMSSEKLTKLFDTSEEYFFSILAEAASRIKSTSYFSSLESSIKRIKVPEIPLSNTYVAEQLSKNIPKKSILHLSILNSLRNMDFFKLDDSILSSCNVGGFGIDGPVSTLIGQSMSNKDRLAIGLVGDLAFFYDMNALGMREIGNNVRIILVNNNNGVEFRLNNQLENQWGSDTDSYISAAGHNGSAKGWVESRGFHYITASSKEELDAQIEEFCHKDINHFNAPVLFEVFTEVANEQKAVDLIRAANSPAAKKVLEKSPTIKKIAKKAAPKKAVDLYKKLKRGR